MDTSQLEKRAEDYISSMLSRNGILVAKPKFDIDGTDLLGLIEVGDGARFFRIQCKGRSIEEDHAFVSVPTEYVSSAFVLCLYLESGAPAETIVFAFFGPEIETNWKRGTQDGRQVCRLEITEERVQRDWTPYLLTDSRIRTLRLLIERANLKGEFKFISTAQGHVTVGAVRCNAEARTESSSSE